MSLHHIFAQLITSSFYCPHYCNCFLRNPRDLPFPFSVRLHAAFCSLSSPDRTRSRAVRARSDQGARRSDPGVIPERSGSTSWSLRLRPTWSQIKRAKPSLHSNLMKLDPVHLVLAYSSKKPQIYSCCPFYKYLNTAYHCLMRSKLMPIVLQ